jgi:hypothetical protein
VQASITRIEKAPDTVDGHTDHQNINEVEETLEKACK